MLGGAKRLVGSRHRRRYFRGAPSHLSATRAATEHPLKRGDWVVCESNPGPYYYGKDPSPGSGGGGTDSGQTLTSKVIRQAARVVKVLDGDTVRVRLASGPRRDVRLIGIDTDGSAGAIKTKPLLQLKGVACGAVTASSYKF